MKKLVFLMMFALVLTGCGGEAGPFDAFAKCLSEKGVKMYGSDSCPHCQAQKQSFKGSFEHVDYVECNQNAKTCQDAGIRAYPTWEIDGEKSEGRMSLSSLAEKSGCELSVTSEDSSEDEEA